MFIYNKRIVDVVPKPQNTKKINVTLEDVLLSFVASENKGDNIYLTYSISYFNIPQGINEFEIERHIELNSLKSVIKETFSSLRYIEIDMLSAKQLRLCFNARKFLIDATYPTKTVSRGFGKSALELNKEIPDIVKQSSENIIPELFSRIMTSIIRKEKAKYNRIFTGLRSWTVSKSQSVKADYDIYKNEFNLELEGRNNLIYYYFGK